MPLMSSRASGSVRAFGLTILSALTSVIDNFNRSNQSGLGPAKGQRWKIWRGAWEILSNTASSSSGPSTHALATLNFTKTDVTISVSGAGPGMGTAFWVSDANNWWAATYEQVYSCQTCGGCAAYNTPQCCAFNTVPANAPGASPNCIPTSNPGPIGNPCCNSCVPKTSPPVGFCQQTYNPYSRNPPAPPNPPSPCPIIPGNPATFPCSGNCFSSPCSAPFTFSCNCTTAHSIKILSAIASTISTAASSAFSSTIASFRAVLSGNNVTIRAYSDSSWASQIGSDWNTNLTSPNKKKAHGIIKSPATFSQSSSIDEFRVS